MSLHPKDDDIRPSPQEVARMFREQDEWNWRNSRVRANHTHWDPDSVRWLLLQPDERARDVALICDGETVRGYVDGVECPELVQFIPAGWHPPLALPEEP